MYEYSWLLDATSGAPDDGSPAVEAGISDAQLDKQMTDDGGVCPIVQLSKEDLRSQIQLLPDGLLGRGVRPTRSACQRRMLDRRRTSNNSVNEALLDISMHVQAAQR
jgi:hypothetical protein